MISFSSLIERSNVPSKAEMTLHPKSLPLCHQLWWARLTLDELQPKKLAAGTFDVQTKIDIEQKNND